MPEKNQCKKSVYNTVQGRHMSHTFKTAKIIAFDRVQKSRCALTRRAANTNQPIENRLTFSRPTCYSRLADITCTTKLINTAARLVLLHIMRSNNFHRKTKIPRLDSLQLGSKSHGPPESCGSLVMISLLMYSLQVAFARQNDQEDADVLDACLSRRVWVQRVSLFIVSTPCPKKN